jgi:hypothetical protein
MLSFFGLLTGAPQSFQVNKVSQSEACMGAQIIEDRFDQWNKPTRFSRKQKTYHADMG